MPASRGAMPDLNELATFLRARRDQLKPADAGLPSGGRRRVAGLRREEVAMLAGISTEYYLRLEQGRECQPSDQVLDSLARALQLCDDAADCMRNLARQAVPRNRASDEPLDPGAQALIENWPLTPAYVQDHRMTVLAANAMARALSPYFAPEMNLLRVVFLEPEVHVLLRNWNSMSETLASWLRFTAAEDGRSDPELDALIGELRAASQRFATLWDRYDAKRGTRGPVFFEHPEVGPLDLRYRRILLLPETRQALVAYDAEPGSPSEERLQMLSGLAALSRS